MTLLDVAVGPVILIYGLILLFVVLGAALLVVFSIKAISKIKQEASQDDQL